MAINIFCLSQGTAVRKNSKENIPIEVLYKQSCRLPETSWECFPGKFMKFLEQLLLKTPTIRVLQ